MLYIIGEKDKVIFKWLWNASWFFFFWREDLVTFSVYSSYLNYFVFLLYLSCFKCFFFLVSGRGWET